MSAFYIRLLFIASGILLTACDRSDEADDLPICVRKQLINRDAIRKPPVEVWRWDVDDKTFYHFISECCDQYNYLFNDNCELVCAPDGGFTGRGDGKCPQFEGQIEKTLIWKSKP